MYVYTYIKLGTHQREQNKLFATDILMNLHLYKFLMLNVFLIMYFTY